MQHFKEPAVIVGFGLSCFLPTALHVASDKILDQMIPYQISSLINKSYPWELHGEGDRLKPAPGCGLQSGALVLTLPRGSTAQLDLS